MLHLDDLISRSDVALQAIDVNSLCNIGGLLLQGHQHIAGLIIKAWTEKLRGLKSQSNKLRVSSSDVSDQSTGLCWSMYDQTIEW